MPPRRTPPRPRTGGPPRRPRRRVCRRTGGSPRRPAPPRPRTGGAYRRRVSRRYRRRTGGKFGDTLKKIGKTALEVIKIVPRTIGINV